MRVLMLSLDKKILEKDSAVRRRLIALGEAVAKTTPAHQNESPPFLRGTTTPALADLPAEAASAQAGDGELPFIKGELTVFVPAEKDERQEVSEHLTIHGVGGGKIVQLWKMWRVGKQILSPIQPPKATPFIKGDTTTPQPLLGKEGRKNYGLITVQDTYFLALLGYRLSKKFRVPLEVQVHGLEKFSGVRKWLAGFVLKRADRVRAVSQRLKKLLTVNYSLLTSKIYELPVYTQVGSLIFNPSSLTSSLTSTTPQPLLGKEGRNSPSIPLLEERGRRNQRFTFLTVGRLVAVKNIALQIRAFARLAKEFPNARLVIAGDGPERRNIQFLISHFQCGDKIILAGQQESVSRFYEEADAFLLTSSAEGWGLVVTEAAAYGLPIIMTDVGLAGEFVKHGKNGLVIPVGDEDALLAAMRRLLTDASLRARVGAAARCSFLALPSAEEQIQKQVEEWESLR